MYEYVLFDLDGTLTDPYEGITKSVCHALTYYNMEENDPAVLRSFIGPPLARRFCEVYGFTDEQGREAVAHFRERFRSVGIYENALYEGIPEMLDALRAKGVKLGVVSNKPDSDAVPLIARYFGQRIAVTIGKKPEYSPKPDPRAVWEAMETLGADKSRTLYVGDSDVDFFTAQNAGIPAALVSWGYRDMEELESCGALTIAHSVAELRSFILEEKEE